MPFIKLPNGDYVHKAYKSRTTVKLVKAYKNNKNTLCGYVSLGRQQRISLPKELIGKRVIIRIEVQK